MFILQAVHALGALFALQIEEQCAHNYDPDQNIEAELRLD